MKFLGHTLPLLILQFSTSAVASISGNGVQYQILQDTETRSKINSSTFPKNNLDQFENRDYNSQDYYYEQEDQATEKDADTETQNTEATLQHGKTRDLEPSSSTFVELILSPFRPIQKLSKMSSKLFHGRNNFQQRKPSKGKRELYSSESRSEEWDHSNEQSKTERRRRKRRKRGRMRGRYRRRKRRRRKPKRQKLKPEFDNDEEEHYNYDDGDEDYLNDLDYHSKGKGNRAQNAKPPNGGSEVGLSYLPPRYAQPYSNEYHHPPQSTGNSGTLHPHQNGGGSGMGWLKYLKYAFKDAQKHLHKVPHVGSQLPKSIYDKLPPMRGNIMGMGMEPGPEQAMRFLQPPLPLSNTPFLLSSPNYYNFNQYRSHPIMIGHSHPNPNPNTMQQNHHPGQPIPVAQIPGGHDYGPQVHYTSVPNNFLQNSFGSPVLELPSSTEPTFPNPPSLDGNNLDDNSIQQHQSQSLPFQSSTTPRHNVYDSQFSAKFRRFTPHYGFRFQNDENLVKPQHTHYQLQFDTLDRERSHFEEEYNDQVATEPQIIYGKWNPLVDRVDQGQSNDNHY